MTIASTLTGKIAIKHPVLRVLCREDGMILNKTHGGGTKTFAYTFGSLDPTGYMRIQINKGRFSVHRLIAEAFLPNISGLPEVDHIDRNRKNNSVSNLRWITSEDNIERMINVVNRDKRVKTRRKDDKKVYRHECGQYQLHLRKPDGSKTSTGLLPDDLYNELKPLSSKERYERYLAWKRSH